jgi:hypothetical protein
MAAFINQKRATRKENRHTSSSLEQKWTYHLDSEKLVLNGDTIAPNVVYIEAASGNEERDLSRGFDEFLALYMPTATFEPLVRAVKRGDLEKATLHLDAEPQGSWSRLVFKELRIAHSKADQTTLSDLGTELRATLRQFQLSLYAIIVLLFLVLVALWQIRH